MTTVSTKHVPTPQGDPAMSIHGGKGTILDDMEILRKYCLPDKLEKGKSNLSNVSFGAEPTEPMRTTKQADYGKPSMADIEPKGTRDARSRYMNTKHFDLGFDAPPLVTHNQSTMQPPSRAALLSQPRNHMIGGPNDCNASSLFQNPDDVRNWTNNLKSTNQLELRPPPGDVRDPFNKEIAKQLRAHHFDFGCEPIDYTSHQKASYPETETQPDRVEPFKQRRSAVQLGSADYDWGKDLRTTHRTAYTPPVVEEDSLTEFVKRGPPMVFGDNPREMMTTYKQSYKNIGYLDCSKLTDEQLRMLGITREQLIPRKVQLPFLSAQMRAQMEGSGGDFGV